MPDSLAYRLIYDAAADGLWYWPAFLWAAIFPMFGVVGCVFVFRRLWRRGRDGPLRSTLLALLLLGATCYYPFVAVRTNYTAYKSFIGRLRAGRFAVVTGVVTDFSPQSPDGHAAEAFEVGTHRYFYSDHELLPGFHTIRAKGGVIAPGLRVRIADIDGYIARLEVAQQSTIIPR
jgi:hypothetical protein